MGVAGEEKDKNWEFQKTWGIILYTTDGWKTWTVQFKKQFGQKGELFSSHYFSKVFFINADIGWAIGNKGIIYHTKDGGKHWTQQESGTTFDLEDVQFVDEKRGWIVGDNGANVEEGDGEGIVLYTEDGGETWHTQLRKKATWLSGLFFVNKDTGWVTGIAKNGKQGLLLHTTDVGKTWISTTIEEEFEDIFFVNKDRGWITIKEIIAMFYRTTKLFITEDGGKTWKKQKIGLHKYPYRPFELNKTGVK